MLSLIVSSIALAAPGHAPALGEISIKGSDTMLILNQRWAEEYSKVNSRTSIAVTGGGSSIGINAFINGVTDIAASSRKMKKSEVDKARSRGAIANEIPVALDGLAIIVNSGNTVKSLTMDQLAKIYTGQITNWRQVGGQDASIVVFSRDSNSGTYGFFQEKVMRNMNWGRGTRFLPSTSEELREVARTPNGIAYGGVAYFAGKKNVKILPIAPRAGETPIEPSEDKVRGKAYPIWRYLYYYTNGKPKGEAAQFINWVLSPAGQRMAEDVGYYSLK